MIEYFNEDCMEGMKRYGDKHFSLAICDPPYRDENQPTKDMRVNNMKKDFGKKPTVEYFAELSRVSKNQIIWGQTTFNFLHSKVLLCGENYQSEKYLLCPCAK